MPHPGCPTRRQEAPPLGRPCAAPQRAKPAGKSARCGIGGGSPYPHTPQPQPVGWRPPPHSPRRGGGTWVSAHPWTPHTKARAPPPPPGRPRAAPQRAKPARKSARCGIDGGSPRPQPPQPQPVGSGQRPHTPKTGGRECRALHVGRPTLRQEIPPPPGALVLPPQRAKPAGKSARCGVGDWSPRPHPPHQQPLGIRSRPHARKDRRSGVGERSIPGSPHPGGGRPPPPPGALVPPPQRAKPAHKSRHARRGASYREKGKGTKGLGHPPKDLNRRSTGPGQETRRATNGLARPYRRPAPEPRVVRAPHQPGGGGRHLRRGSTGAHTRNGHAERTRGATGPSPRNAQTAWNGVTAGEGKGHPVRTTRNTHREGREGREEPKGRSKNQHRPRPPRPAASAAHTRQGFCTRQGSSSTQCYAPAPRLGSLCASPWASHWRQASSTGPAAPAGRATTHQRGGVVAKRLQPRLLREALTGEW